MVCQYNQEKSKKCIKSSHNIIQSRIQNHVFGYNLNNEVYIHHYTHANVRGGD